MTIDTAKLRERASDAIDVPWLRAVVLQLCDELNQARIRAADNTLMAQHNADLMRELEQARAELDVMTRKFNATDVTNRGIVPALKQARADVLSARAFFQTLERAGWGPMVLLFMADTEHYEQYR